MRVNKENKESISPTLQCMQPLFGQTYTVYNFRIPPEALNVVLRIFSLEPTECFRYLKFPLIQQYTILSFSLPLLGSGSEKY